MKYSALGALVGSAIAIGGCASTQSLDRDAKLVPLTFADRTAIPEPEDIEQIVHDTLFPIWRSEDIPSISSGVIYDGMTRADANFGTLERNGGTSLSGDSIYQIASLSKTLTGIIVQSLIVEGRLQPHEDIVTYLAPVLTAEAKTRLDGVTLIQLMQHRSAIADKDCAVYRNRAEGEVVQSGYSRVELVADLNAIDLSGRDTGAFAYTSCGYAVAGLIGELVTGKDFDTLLRQYVAGPYDMPDTTVTLNDEQKSRLVTAYNKRKRSEEVLPYIMGKASPGSAIYSTVHDLINLQAAQIKAYREFEKGGDAGALILTEAVTSARLRHNAGEAEFGSGLIIIPHPKGPFYVHDGDLDGFGSVYTFSPKNNAGVVILTGSGGQWVTESAIGILVDLIDETQSVGSLAP